MLVYGKNPMFHLMNRIDTREDKYEIAMKISIDDGIEKIISLAEEYDGVIIGDISAGFRNQLVKFLILHCIYHGILMDLLWTRHL